MLVLDSIVLTFYPKKKKFTHPCVTIHNLDKNILTRPYTIFYVSSLREILSFQLTHKFKTTNNFVYEGRKQLSFQTFYSNCTRGTLGMYQMINGTLTEIIEKRGRISL